MIYWEGFGSASGLFEGRERNFNGNRKKKSRSGFPDSSWLSYDSKAEVLICLIGQGMCYTLEIIQSLSCTGVWWGDL
jgi:hypothetical protein